MTGHQYGPHRPADNPQTIEVWGKWGDRQQLPYPAALAEQRRNINQRACAPAPVSTRDGGAGR